MRQLLAATDMSNTTGCLLANNGHWGEHLREGTGSRNAREFTRDDICVVFIVKWCLKFGASPERAAAVGRSYRRYVEKNDPKRTDYLLVTDREWMESHQHKGKKVPDSSGHCSWVSSWASDGPTKTRSHIGGKNELMVEFSASYIQKLAEDVIEHA